MFDIRFRNVCLIFAVLLFAPAMQAQVQVLSSVALSFPNTAVGGNSATQNVQLQIASSLTISSISVPQAQGGVQEFTVRFLDA